VNIWKLAAVLLLLLAAACDRPPRTSSNTISEDRFVEAYVAMSRVRADTITEDTARADSLRAAVLAEHGLTEEQMREFVSARSRNPQQLATVWEQIRTRLEQGDDPLPEGVEQEEWDRRSADDLAPYTTEDEAPEIPQRLQERLAPRVQ
jgi:hypothetical protein